jgi:hypothetical protein
MRSPIIIRIIEVGIVAGGIMIEEEGEDENIAIRLTIIESFSFMSTLIVLETTPDIKHQWKILRKGK